MSDSQRPLNLLLLCDYRTDIGATVSDHIRALERHSRHRYYRLSILGDIPAAVDLARFDGVVIHYSLFASHEMYLSRRAHRRLSEFGGLKAIFIQDEYRHVDATIEAMRAIGINLLFTCIPAEEIDKVYSPERLPGMTKVNVLTGYVPEPLCGRAVRPYADRPIDIGYRGRRLPPWLGELGQEKWRIGVRVAADAGRYGLAADISFREEDRLYGRAWIAFVTSCKAMLGVESGASVFDFTGDIQHQVESYLATHPDADFDETRTRFFAAEEGRIRLNQISPRCFEAASLRTLMILYEGRYSDILQPWRHYVPLKKDHSNMDEVVAVLRDPPHAQEIIDRAYREIALNPRYSFAEFVRGVDAVIDGLIEPRMLSRAAPYQRGAFKRAAFSIATLKRRSHRKLLLLAYQLIFRCFLYGSSTAQRDRAHARLRRFIHHSRRLKRLVLGPRPS